MGWTDSPRIFSMIMKAVAKVLREQGIRMVIFLDDILILSESREECIRQRDILISLLDRLGLTLSVKKSKLDPTQRIEFLGTIVDSIKMVFEVPQEKLDRYLDYLSKLVRKTESGSALSLNSIRSAIGCLGSVSECIPATRLHMNHLLRTAIAAEKTPKQQLVLPVEAQEELKWWLVNFRSWNGKPINSASPTHFFDTDASHHGWGGVYIGKEGKRVDAHGRFLSRLTSNERELRAIFHATQSFIRQLEWKDCSIRVRTDNQIALSYVNKMGGKLPHLLTITELLHNFCLTRNITISAEYLPGVKNVAADQLSRIETDWSEAKLNTSLFQLIQERWGKMEMDCFASNINCQVET
ncbi:MAG: reverse transcriptase domain-containing protein, partial [Candidatus Saccharimonadales bacterium]